VRLVMGGAEIASKTRSICKAGEKVKMPSLREREKQVANLPAEIDGALGEAKGEFGHRQKKASQSR